MPNAIVADTNVFIHDPKAIDILREGENTLFIPWTVILELDRLKTKPDVGFDAREAIAKIEELREQNCISLLISKEASFRNLKMLKRGIADHEIIATARKIAENNRKKKEFDKVKLLSRDRTVRLLARELKLGLTVENYYRDEINDLKSDYPKTINVPFEMIDFEKRKFQNNGFEAVKNEGVICYSGNGTTSWSEQFAAIKKGCEFRLIDNDISAVGLKPQSLNGDGPNWGQTIALAQLLDPDISLVILQGGAGTGKTLLAMAAAIEQRTLYHNIIVTRPMVHLADEDNMGFLPGDENDKMKPWLRPINIALSFLKNIKDSDNKGMIERMENAGKITYESLDYIRGMSYHKTLLIVDEAQNLTPHQIKTIITRAGTGTKIIINGDLGQIDVTRRLDRKSSGLAYAINRLRGEELVAITNFKESIRSPLASLGSSKL